ncbi:MAG: endolytic transglycosylase MltG, partial [Chloroflexota bacterium]
PRGGAVILVVLVVVAAVFGVSVLALRRTLGNDQPLLSPAPSLAPGTEVNVTITPGETSTQIAHDLQAKGLVPSDVVFLGVLKLRGQGSTFQVGVHQLAAGTSMDDLITQLETPAAPRQIRVTFPEGRRLEEDAQVASQAGIGTSAQFLQAAQHPDPTWSYTFLSDKPKGVSLEGYLFPDTFFMPAKSPTSAELIKKMLDDFNTRVTPQLRQQIAAHKRTLFDTIIIASIVEREAKVASERPLIAGVYWNRLDSHQGLYADPTVQYAVGTPQNWWPALQAGPATLAPSSPYNTYTHGGLPPGPISNPGLASIEAAANPQGDYLYFVAKNDGSGEHAFARTLAEHNANRAKYQGTS